MIPRAKPLVWGTGFPKRIWEVSYGGTLDDPKWVSRPVTKADKQRRGEMCMEMLRVRMKRDPDVNASGFDYDDTGVDIAPEDPELLESVPGLEGYLDV